MAYPYEYFNKIEDYQDSVNILKKEDIYCKLKSNYPDDSEIERSNQNNKLFDIENEELTRFNMKTNLISWLMFLRNL